MFLSARAFVVALTDASIAQSAFIGSTVTGPLALDDTTATARRVPGSLYLAVHVVPPIAAAVPPGLFLANLPGLLLAVGYTPGPETVDAKRGGRHRAHEQQRRLPGRRREAAGGIVSVMTVVSVVAVKTAVTPLSVITAVSLVSRVSRVAMVASVAPVPAVVRFVVVFGAVTSLSAALMHDSAHAVIKQGR